MDPKTGRRKLGVVIEKVVYSYTGKLDVPRLYNNTGSKTGRRKLGV